VTRNETYNEIESTLGFVPTWFKLMTDQELETEWNTWRQMENKGVIPDKYSSLIGLASAATMQDKYGIYWWTESAKMCGATEEEIKEVGSMLKWATGWTPFLRLHQVDYEQFKQDVRRTMEAFQNRVQQRASI
jgi:alkylhydroperoxidase/carboxymuconolactone decarboxylase family protein YurZ